LARMQLPSKIHAAGQIFSVADWPTAVEDLHRHSIFGICCGVLVVLCVFFFYDRGRQSQKITAEDHYLQPDKTAQTSAILRRARR